MQTSTPNHSNLKKLLLLIPAAILIAASSYTLSVVLSPPPTNPTKPNQPRYTPLPVDFSHIGAGIQENFQSTYILSKDEIPFNSTSKSHDYKDYFPELAKYLKKQMEAPKGILSFINNNFKNFHLSLSEKKPFTFSANFTSSSDAFFISNSGNFIHFTYTFLNNSSTSFDVKLSKNLKFISNLETYKSDSFNYIKKQLPSGKDNPIIINDKGDPTNQSEDSKALDKISFFPESKLTQTETQDQTAQEGLDALDNKATRTEIDGSSKNLTGFANLSAFPNLKVLNLNNNQLTSIGITKNSKLEEIRLNKNQLAVIDLSKNPDLNILYLSDNEGTKRIGNFRTQYDNLYSNDFDGDDNIDLASGLYHKETKTNLKVTFDSPYLGTSGITIEGHTYYLVATENFKAIKALFATAGKQSILGDKREDGNIVKMWEDFAGNNVPGNGNNNTYTFTTFEFFTNKDKSLFLPTYGNVNHSIPGQERAKTPYGMKVGLRGGNFTDSISKRPSPTNPTNPLQPYGNPIYYAFSNFKGTDSIIINRDKSGFQLSATTFTFDVKGPAHNEHHTFKLENLSIIFSISSKNYQDIIQPIFNEKNISHLPE